MNVKQSECLSLGYSTRCVSGTCYAESGHICKSCMCFKIAQKIRQLGIKLVMIFTRSASELASNFLWPFAKEGLAPLVSVSD